jgi:hypothetical protein
MARRVVLMLLVVCVVVAGLLSGCGKKAGGAAKEPAADQKALGKSLSGGPGSGMKVNPQPPGGGSK